jgi:hypothetical protein
MATLGCRRISFIKMLEGFRGLEQVNIKPTTAASHFGRHSTFSKSAPSLCFAFCCAPGHDSDSLVQSAVADAANLHLCDTRARQHGPFLSRGGKRGPGANAGALFAGIRKCNITNRSSNRSTLRQSYILRRPWDCWRSSRCFSSQCLRGAGHRDIAAQELVAVDQVSGFGCAAPSSARPPCLPTSPRCRTSTRLFQRHSAAGRKKCHERSTVERLCLCGLGACIRYRNHNSGNDRRSARACDLKPIAA